ncbi:TraB/GumN family protein [Candidatus Woesearchaeota archaeon]|jgi:pheromone shutdown-related protein TraB|nr:TraB/GumN family protein [Candidatus Woesearchaeota archaeon]
MNPNIKLVGTSHISPESKKKINSAFNEHKPDIICVELDKQRLQGLIDKNRKRPGIKAIKQLGFTGYLFAIIGGYTQKKLGNITGMAPGEEMLLGVTLAQRNKLRLELIDQEITKTLKKISKTPIKEKLKIILDIIKAPFQKKQRMKIDISKIPEEEFVKKLTKQVKERYPYIYKVIIDERNKIMAKKIFLLQRQNPTQRILAIIGEGHIEGIIEQLKKLEQDNITYIKQN